jgi:hypothetical protein
VYGLAVYMSRWECEDIGCVYLGQDMGVRIWAGSIYFRICV